MAATGEMRAGFREKYDGFTLSIHAASALRLASDISQATVVPSFLAIEIAGLELGPDFDPKSDSGRGELDARVLAQLHAAGNVVVVRECGTLEDVLVGYALLEPEDRFRPDKLRVTDYMFHLSVFDNASVTERLTELGVPQPHEIFEAA